MATLTFPVEQEDGSVISMTIQVQICGRGIVTNPEERTGDG